MCGSSSSFGPTLEFGILILDVCLLWPAYDRPAYSGSVPATLRYSECCNIFEIELHCGRSRLRIRRISIDSHQATQWDRPSAWQVGAFLHLFWPPDRCFRCLHLRAASTLATNFMRFCDFAILFVSSGNSTVTNGFEAKTELLTRLCLIKQIYFAKHHLSFS